MIFMWRILKASHLHPSSISNNFSNMSLVFCDDSFESRRKLHHIPRLLLSLFLFRAGGGGSSIRPVPYVSVCVVVVEEEKEFVDLVVELEESDVQGVNVRAKTDIKMAMEIEDDI